MAVQVPGPELPPSPPVTPVAEVSTPEPGIYHGICEYPAGQAGRPPGTGLPGVLRQVAPAETPGQWVRAEAQAQLRAGPVPSPRLLRGLFAFAVTLRVPGL